MYARYRRRLGLEGATNREASDSGRKRVEAVFLFRVIRHRVERVEFIAFVGQDDFADHIGPRCLNELRLRYRDHLGDW